MNGLFNEERQQQSSDSLPWYAVRIKSKCERTAAEILASRGHQAFLPAYQVRRRWSDRIVEKSVPLFPGYLFCRFDIRKKVPVISVPGVVSVVGFGSEPVPVPDADIDAVHAMLQSGLPVQADQSYREGQRVRVVHGPLQGLQGLLVRKEADYRFVVSIELLQRSVSVPVDPADIAAC